MVQTRSPGGRWASESNRYLFFPNVLGGIDIHSGETLDTLAISFLTHAKTTTYLVIMLGKFVLTHTIYIHS